MVDEKKPSQAEAAVADKNPQEVTGNPSFEEALAELEKIIAAMEQGEVSLAESVQYYQRAMALHRYCGEQLSSAKLKIEQLLLAPDDKKGGEKKIVGKKNFAGGEE